MQIRQFVRGVALATVIIALFAAERVLERVVTARAAQRSPLPSYQVDPFWPKVPARWILGQVSGVAVDPRDHVWIIQRPWSLNDDEKAANPDAECCHPAPPVMEFDAAGN